MTPLIYLDRSDVREGREDELEAAFRTLATFVEDHEPWLISYAVAVSPDRRRTAVLSVHRDAASLRRHLEVIGDQLAAFTDLLRLRSIEVFGDIDGELLALLQAKADLLGADSVSVQPVAAGFLRAEPFAL
jgi:quinol monooxygenase YgiN